MNIDSIAIEAATDGACSGNPGPGGWGGLIIFDDKSELEIGGSEQNTTNNRMEPVSYTHLTLPTKCWV